jgi:hypothetical protein
MNSKSSIQASGVKPDSLHELRNWIDDYRQSAGQAADGCVELLQTLLDGQFLEPPSRDLLLELLVVLEGLSADPITISCAMLHVAQQSGDDLGGIVAGLPADVRQQLQELNKLKLYESDHTLSGTERSAEGLRRLLLALVKDVRVVLIDLAWELVLLRRARANSELGRALARETTGQPAGHLAVEVGTGGPGFSLRATRAIPARGETGCGTPHRAGAVYPRVHEQTLCRTEGGGNSG